MRIKPDSIMDGKRDRPSWGQHRLALNGRYGSRTDRRLSAATTQKETFSCLLLFPTLDA